MTGLNQAHKGYLYQDLACAYALVFSLLDRPNKIFIDTKSHEDDLFDDLRLIFEDREEAYQFKFSENPGDQLTIEDFRTSKRDLRIDHLIQSVRKDNNAKCTTYFLVTTLLDPTDELTQYLVQTDEQSKFGGTVYRFDLNSLWPETNTFQWKLHKNFLKFERAELEELSKRIRVIVSTPRPSFDLRSAGHQETTLLKFLSDTIGIGHYPNQDKDTVDVAATLIYFATLVRQSPESTTPERVIQYVQLRTDFGKIPQEFPVDLSQLVERKSAIEEFLQFAKKHPISVLVGSPGTGKSWFIDRSIRALKSAAVPVIHHYCYVSPFDNVVGSRINQRVLYGNLVSELLAIDPSLQEIHRPFYSATRESFENLILKASETVDEVYIIIDGLDHISRVLHQHPEISSVEAEIVAELSMLKLPSNVHLVLSAQPGTHLLPFETQQNTFPIPKWTETETEILLSRYLDQSKKKPDEWSGAIKGFHTKSEGNPLYLTYLIKDYSDVILKSPDVNAEEFLSQQVTIAGDIKIYYEHLLSTAQKRGVEEVLIRLFGLVDFALIENDITEILGHIVAPPITVSECLNILRPILNHFKSQGGYRIYHESFRRFVFDRLTLEQMNLSQALTPIVSWLEKRGLFSDPLAFRFLISMLLRSNRLEDIQEKFSLDFVDQALTFGHAYEAIDFNLELGIEACAKIEDLPRFVTIWELRRSLYECFEGKLTSLDLRRNYALALGNVRGWEALSRSLLFEGMPVLDKNEGLIVCQVCDEHGIVPPWREYLDLPNTETDTGSDDKDYTYQIAFFVGRCRTNPEMLDRLVEFLQKSKEVDQSYLRKIANQAVRIFGAKTIEDLVSSTSGISSFKQSPFLTALAAQYKAVGDIEGIKRIEALLVKISPGLENAFELLTLGLDLSKFSFPNNDFTQFNIGLSGTLYSIDPHEFENWLNSISVAAFRARDEIIAFRSAINSDSWYSCWLRFLILLVTTLERNISTNASVSDVLVAELKELSKFNQSFAGVPRTCDLYGIRSYTLNSFRIALKNLQSQNIFRTAIEALLNISSNSTTYLQNSPGGPLIHSELLNLVIETTKDSNLIRSASDLLLGLVERYEAQGEYYETLAEHQLVLARLYTMCGNLNEARDRFYKGCEYLSCYGFRKDATIYELIDSMHAVALDKNIAIDVANKTLSLLRAVQTHTDGKGTKQVFIAWFSDVLSFAPESALVLLGDSINSPTGFTSWQMESCVESIIKDLTDRLDPTCFAGIELGLRIDDHFSIDKFRLEKVLSYLEGHQSEIDQNILSAHLIEDSHTITADWIEKVSRSFSLPNQISTVPPGAHYKNDDQNLSHDKNEDINQDLYQAVLNGKSAQELRAGLKAIQSTYIDGKRQAEILSNLVGYRICEFLNQNKQKEYELYVQCLDTELYFPSRAHFWEYLADGLYRIGHLTEAADCYVRSHCRSRGGGGWMISGGAESRELLYKAISIDCTEAIKSYMRSIHRHAKGTSYGLGLTKHLIEDLNGFGNHPLAKACWDTAYAIIAKRLPSQRFSFGPFEHGLEVEPFQDFDSSILYLICCRINDAEQRRKSAAISALANIISTDPIRLEKPIRRIFNRNTTLFSFSIILRLIEEYESAPYPLSHVLKEDLRSLIKLEHFFISRTAAVLLTRINERVPPPQKVCTQRSSLLMKADPQLLNLLDWGYRIERLSKIFPDLDSKLTYEFTRLQNTEQFKAKMKDRLEYYDSRVQRSYPSIPAIGWHQEEFDRILNELLIAYSLEFKDDERGEKEEILRNILFPQLRNTINFFKSRRIRPDLPFPSNITDQDANTLEEIPTGEFSGWKILGRVEEQLEIESPLSSYKGTRLIHSGVILHDGLVHPDMAPIATAQVRPSNGISKHMLIGPINVCAFEYPSSFWGRISILALESRLVERLELKAFVDGDILKYFDSVGNVVCCVVTWSSWFLGSDIAEESPILRGMALVIKPTYWEELLKKINKRFVFRVRTTFF